MSLYDKLNQGSNHLVASLLGQDPGPYPTPQKPQLNDKENEVIDDAKLLHGKEGLKLQDIEGMLPDIQDIRINVVKQKLAEEWPKMDAERKIKMIQSNPDDSMITKGLKAIIPGREIKLQKEPENPIKLSNDKPIEATFKGRNSGYPVTFDELKGTLTDEAKKKEFARLETTLPFRMNNPGNIMWEPGKEYSGGSKGEKRASGGHYVKFAKPEDGIRALQNDLIDKIETRGEKSFRDVVATYIGKDNDYGSMLEKDFGVAGLSYKDALQKIGDENKFGDFLKDFMKYEGYFGSDPVRFDVRSVVDNITRDMPEFGQLKRMNQLVKKTN